MYLASVLAKPHMNPYQQTSLWISPSPQKRQEATRTPTEVFLVCFSLWNHDKWSSAMQCKVNQYMHVASKASFITPPFTVSFSKKFFHLCLLQEDMPSHVWPSKTFQRNHKIPCLTLLETFVVLRTGSHYVSQVELKIITISNATASQMLVLQTWTTNFN